MYKLLLGGAAAAMFASAAIAAQPAPPTPPGVAQGTSVAPQVRTVVRHAPMKVQTREQVVAHARTMFARLDSDRDGYVTRAEAGSAHRAKAHGARRTGARHAGNRLPQANRGAMFDRLDVNRDGSISRQEFVSAQPRVHERRTMVMRDGRAARAGQPGMRRVGMTMHGRMFDRADANRDGRVSLQEATTAALAHFDRADANRDGRLTPDERMQMRQLRRTQRMRPA